MADQDEALDEALALLDRARAEFRPQPLTGVAPAGRLPGSGRAELVDWDEREYPRRGGGEDDDRGDSSTVADGGPSWVEANTGWGGSLSV